MTESTATSSPPAPRDPAPGDAGSSDASSGGLSTWLRKLATESWEAELLVSGFAIVGAIQLLGYIEPLADWLLFHARFEVLGYFYYVFVYLSIGAVALPMVFVLHFVSRAFWVGLVSFSSVYPHGIGPERNATMPEAYVEEVRRDYPSIPVLIDRVERIASTLFIQAALLTMIFVSIAFVLTAAMAVSLLLERASDGLLPFGIAIKVICGTLVGTWVLSMILLVPAIRERPGMEAVYLRASRISRKVLYTVFERPSVTLQTILMTNHSGGSMAKVGGVAYVIILVGGMAFLINSRVMHLSNGERLWRDALDETHHDTRHYRDQWREDHLALHPYVASEVLEDGGPLVVYIPLLGEDEYQIGERSTDFEAPEGATDAEERRALQLHGLAADRDYFRFEIAGQPVEPEAFQWDGAAGAVRGVRAVLPVPRGTPDAFVAGVFMRDPERDGGWLPRARITVRGVGVPTTAASAPATAPDTEVPLGTAPAD